MYIKLIIYASVSIICGMLRLVFMYIYSLMYYIIAILVYTYTYCNTNKYYFLTSRTNKNKNKKKITKKDKKVWLMKRFDSMLPDCFIAKSNHHLRLMIFKMHRESLTQLEGILH